MKYLTLLAFALLTGCAVPRATVAPTTAQARLYGQKAMDSAGEAKTAIRSGKQAIAILERTATPEQRPAVETVRRSLTVADAKTSEVEASLRESHEQLFALDGRIQGLARDRDKLIDAERRARDARSFWRKWALLSSGASALLLAWVLRKPILRLVGVPTR